MENHFHCEIQDHSESDLIRRKAFMQRGKSRIVIKNSIIWKQKDYWSIKSYARGSFVAIKSLNEREDDYWWKWRLLLKWNQTRNGLFMWAFSELKIHEGEYLSKNEFNEINCELSSRFIKNRINFKENKIDDWSIIFYSDTIEEIQGWNDNDEWSDHNSWEWW